MLEDYILVYELTALPIVLFSQYTKANEVLTFDSSKLYIPNDLKGLGIELRISLFDEKGMLIELTSDMLPASNNIIAAVANLTGLKLVKKLIEKLANN